MYKIKEIYYTLQGEGGHVGRASVFCRFTGCNLWTGREKDRKDAVCQFCDTDFVGMDGENGGKYSAKELANNILDIWNKETLSKGIPYVVFTGGEPLLQLDVELTKAMKDVGFEVAIETNGTIEAPEGIDWICMSPKANSEIVLKKGNELKLVYPQKDLEPKQFESFEFDYFYLQPMDSVDQAFNIQETIQYCLKNPQWRMSLQTHKIVNIP